MSLCEESECAKRKSCNVAIVKLIIYCTEDEASIICDAIIDKYHGLKPSPSERGQELAAKMKRIGDFLKEGIRLAAGDDTITVRVD